MTSIDDKIELYKQYIRSATSFGQKAVLELMKKNGVTLEECRKAFYRNKL